MTAQAAFQGREIVRTPDMCNVDMTDTVSWYAEESVRLTVEPWRCGRRVEIPQGATAAWVVCDEGGTNWIVRYDSAPSATNCVFSLAAGEGALPAGHDYAGYVSLLSGTNILGVIDHHNIVVLGQASDGGGEISPEGGAWGSVLQRLAEAEHDIQGIAGDLAHQAEDIAAIEEGLADSTARLDSLWAECVGGFRWPDYFTVAGVAAGVLPGTVTNAASESVAVCNVLVETVQSSTLKGWRIDTEVYRQVDLEEKVRWEAFEASRGGGRDKAGSPTAPIPSIPPDELEIKENVVHFAEGVEAASGPFAAVRGTLGDYMVELELDFDPSKQSATSTVRRFAGPAPGSLLAASWSNVIGTASNGAALEKTAQLRTWPEGYGSGTDHVPAGWNTDFWGAELGDFSCVSYHTEKAGAAPGGVYMPLMMVTPRHAVCANHWKPGLGSNVWWVSRSGAILTNSVAAYANVRGDLAVARLDHAFDTNDIAPAALLAPGFHSYLYGSTNYASGLFGVPVLGFDAAERGYVMNWVPDALRKGRIQGAADDTTFHLAAANGREVPFFRTQAVGGDSGSPVFWPVDGHLLLLGCFHTPQSGPLPGKAEIDAAIAAWGDEERTQEYDLGHGGWRNYDAPPGP